MTRNERALHARQGPAGVESARATLLASATRLRAETARLHGAALSAAAGAAVAFGALPPKLNPFIQPLMGSVRRETDAPLQARAARSLASLIKLCVGRAPSPVHKIAGNVVALACADPAETPRAEWDDAAMTVAAASAAAHEGPTEAEIARRGADACLLALCDVFGDALWRYSGKPLPNAGFALGCKAVAPLAVTSAAAAAAAAAAGLPVPPAAAKPAASGEGDDDEDGDDEEGEEEGEGESDEADDGSAAASPLPTRDS